MRALGENEDDDFDFQDNDSKQKGQKATVKEEKVQKIENHHFDEAVDLSDNGSGMPAYFSLNV
jgi:hypothetical protein